MSGEARQWSVAARLRLCATAAHSIKKLESALDAFRQRKNYQEPALSKGAGFGNLSFLHSSFCRLASRYARLPVPSP
jgi:hypothetical protein